MGNRRLLIVLLAVTLLAGCGGGGAADSSNAPGDLTKDFPNTQPSGPSAVGGTGGSGSIVTTPSVPSSNGGIQGPAAGLGLSTTDGGSITIQKRLVLTLANTQTYAGIAADSAGQYILLKEAYSGGFNKWNVYKLATGSATFQSVCGVLDDNHISGGLQVDANYFYMSERNGSPQDRLRRFSRTTCAETTSIYFGSSYTTCYADYYNMDPLLSAVTSSAVFFRNLCKMGQLTTSTGLLTNTAIDIILGKSRLRFESSNINGWAKSTNAWWVASSYDNYSIWKLNNTYGAVGWVSLPTSTYPDLTKIKGMASADGLTLVVATSNSTLLSLYFIDVSSF